MTPPRAAAMLGLLAAIGALYGLASTPAFTLARTEVPDLRWTTREAVMEAIGTPDGANLFQLRTGPLEDRLRALPGVAQATVTVSLPDTLIVDIQERQAILVWAVGESRFLVDRDGVIFANLTPDAAGTSTLPAIVDTRPESGALHVGSIVDPVDLDAATRLASVKPSDVGSAATSLSLTVTEASGFVLVTTPRTWTAVFGLYTPSVRTTTIIPGQVRLLRSLLEGRESGVASVILADADSGTYVLKPTSAP